MGKFKSEISTLPQRKQGKCDTSQEDESESASDRLQPVSTDGTAFAVDCCGCLRATV